MQLPVYYWSVKIVLFFVAALSIQNNIIIIGSAFVDVQWKIISC